ncbi:hypothetical protein AUJ69_02700 [Candidatus Woesearchaeota archaeon CG1_02_47_18]|nr:MAG: hypothetical protein AUJ69_02700 [Candidatus Woesearchaeota archaeon CG1_02_47_18]HII30063.1 hypothetical protein [Candidatus Woesearchaeota archaeon]
MTSSSFLRGWVKQSTLVVALFSVVVILTPIAARYLHYDNLLIGGEVYYNARIAEDIAQKGIMLYDRLTFSGEHYSLSAFNVLLAALGSRSRIYLALLVMPFVLGPLSAVLLYLWLGCFRIKRHVRIVAALLFAASPAFLHTFCSSSIEAAGVFTLLLGLLLATRGGFANRLAALLALMISALFGPLNMVISLFTLNYYASRANKSRAMLWVMMLSLAVFSIFFYAFWCIHLNQIPRISFDPVRALLLSDLGSETGVGVFSVVLAAIGFIYCWRERAHLRLFYWALLIVLAYNTVSLNYYIYISLFIAPFSAFGIEAVLTREWDIETIKKFTLLLILCGLSFSTISYMHRLVWFRPSREEAYSLRWLGSYDSYNSKEARLVLSEPGYGSMIQYFSGLPIVITPKSSDVIINDTRTMFHSRNLNRTTSIMERYSVAYVWLGEGARERIWKKDDEGLLFLLRNNKTFKNIYSDNGIEIWEVMQPEEP